MTHPDSRPIADFLARWGPSGAAERSNYQLFLLELCDLLGLERPHPASEIEADNAYIFEKPVPSPHGTTNSIDLYKRGCFVLEAKQGSERPDPAEPPFSEKEVYRRKHARRGAAVRETGAWDTAMEKARQQAQAYARGLPPEEIDGGRPPFVITVDVGSTISLYSEFSRTGGNYVPFPDPAGYRLTLEDLHEPEVQALLKAVWTDPLSLDPARRSARVTREIAARLAALARSLEAGHDPEDVAQFLMRCLFTMFAEDVGLLPDRSFTRLLVEIRAEPATFQPLIEHLWETMDTGGFSVILRKTIPRFNGGLFAERAALPLTLAQIELLEEAAQADWRDVEPAIFGTLLERALDPVERHKLGAHYTPRAYVERLVKPTIIDPLRAEWEEVQAAALLLSEGGERAKAIAEVEAFHRRLATVRVLDPACGSGNFLYVTLELMKRLEGEVLNTLRELGQGQMRLGMEGVTVNPAQFLGIEINPRAAAIAELVLWIGYLQWHFRAERELPLSDPIVKNLHNIKCRDAVLAWDAVEPLLDAAGQPVTRWDGRTMKAHPVTGEPVPDETARIPAYRYVNPRKADWPRADFVVGNPPFVGIARMREALGDGYTEALRKTYGDLPESIDYVMYWWHVAAGKVRAGELERFGLITTNGIRQTLNRRVLQKHMEVIDPLSLIFAIPDHPWVDTAEGAAVRISMTVADRGTGSGVLKRILSEEVSAHGEANITLNQSFGKIQADLTIGAEVAKAKLLESNQAVSSRGFELGSAGFIVSNEEAVSLGLGKTDGLDNHIRPYLNGRDLAQKSRGVMAIDLHGLTESKVRSMFPEVYQWLYERVKPQREQNRDLRLREFWWLHRRSRDDLREMLTGLDRFISTIETSKHRYFLFLDEGILPDNKLINIALDDAYFLAVLSSRIHVTWALAAGGWLGAGNDPVYVKTRCFETFPFPTPSNPQKAHIRALGEDLDAHRKRQQAQHPDLTLTDMYNVLEKLRTGEQLTPKDREIHEKGLVSVLKQLHDDLDAAVAEAYGWPPDLADEEILERLVALNAERAAEEAHGLVRWLRPEYQAPEAVTARQPTLIEAEPDETPAAAEAPEWPDGLKEQVTAVRRVLRGTGGTTPEAVAAAFRGRRSEGRSRRVEEILETLVALGQAEPDAEGRYSAG